MAKGRHTNKSTRQSESVTPQSLGQFFWHIVWQLRPMWRNVLLALAAVCVIAFVIFKALPEAIQLEVTQFVKNAVNPSTPLSPDATKRRDYFIALGESFIQNRPDQALEYFREALKIDPDNVVVRRKIEQLEMGLLR